MSSLSAQVWNRRDEILQDGECDLDIHRGWWRRVRGPIKDIAGESGVATCFLILKCPSGEHAGIFGDPHLGTRSDPPRLVGSLETSVAILLAYGARECSLDKGLKNVALGSLVFHGGRRFVELS